MGQRETNATGFHKGCQTVPAEAQLDQATPVEMQPQPEAPNTRKTESKARSQKATPTVLPPWLCGASRRRIVTRHHEHTEARVKTTPKSQEIFAEMQPGHLTPADTPADNAQSCNALRSRGDEDRPKRKQVVCADMPTEDARSCTAVRSIGDEDGMKREQLPAVGSNTQATEKDIRASSDTAPTAKDTRGKSKIVSSPVSKHQYEGVVTWFRGTWGWIDSTEVTKMYPDCNVYVHINDCDFRPRQWDRVCFQLAEADGKPKAVGVSMWREPARINARDWIASRQKA